MIQDSSHHRNITDYDIVAFDMDFTIINYKFKPFMKLMYEAAAVYMIGYLGYPPELIPPTEEEELLYHFCSRWVIDKKRLWVLKISEDSEVLLAYNGYDKVPNEDLIKEYGEQPKINPFCPDTLRSNEY